MVISNFITNVFHFYLFNVLRYCFVNLALLV